VEELLKQPQVEGSPDLEGLAGRQTHEHWVVRGDELETAVLIAARKDNTTFLECLEYEVNEDHPYTEKGKPKMARSRILVCKVGFEQNVGHLGKEIVVCGVHGHNRTMKFEWPQELIKFWDRLSAKIVRYGIQYLAGDFNMSLTEVVKQLRSRGLQCDCIAWYPWCHATTEVFTQPLGMDSCGIFYIGGSVQVSMPWCLNELDILLATRDEIERITASGECPPLDLYRGFNTPGMHWACYRSFSIKQPEEDKDLRQRLEDLLGPSTTIEELRSIKKRQGSTSAPYLRLKQKTMDRSEWLVGEQVHNGAHFPLCVFTNNSRARSKDAAMARSQRRPGKGKPQKSDPAVAERSYYSGFRYFGPASNSGGWSSSSWSW
jgi:hypothetical protein